MGKNGFYICGVKSLRESALYNYLKHLNFTTKIQRFQGNMKETWKTLTQLMNKRSKSTNIDLLKQYRKNTSNKKEISDTMNKYFCLVGKALAEELDDTPTLFCQVSTN